MSDRKTKARLDVALAMQSLGREEEREGGRGEEKGTEAFVGRVRCV